MRLSTLVGTVVLLLAAAPASAQSERIAFDGDRGGDFEIYTIAPDGSQLLELTDNQAQDWNPAWSPTGRRIAYIHAAQVWLMRADGSRQRAVTRGMADVRDVDWSPDGRRLVFASDHGHDGQQDLYTIAPDGTGLRRITSGGAAELHPAWSPAGDRIAFVRARAEVYRIATATPDGDDLRYISGSRGTAFSPAWSPSGHKLAYANVDDLLFIIRADGTGRRRIGYGGGSPAWSPTGGRLAVEDQDDDSGSTGVIDVIRADGTARRRLTPWSRRYLAENPDWTG